MVTTTQDQAALAQLAARVPQIVAQAGHSEMWGVELAVSAASPDEQQQREEGDEGGNDAPTLVVLQKFLRANNDDVAAAEKQLTAALEWRKAVDPAGLVGQPFDARRFGGLGFVTTHDDGAGKDVVVTWNIYGSVKDNKATFGNVQDFIKWRAALMELGVQKLRLNDIKEPIAAGAEDPYRMMQVHDYQSVNFFRMDPDVKAASRETIQTLSMAYPELLAHKYFVNVPVIMGWVFGAMKFFLAPATLRKFHPMASGTSLAAELKGIAQSLPVEYGGQGPSVKEGLTVRLTDDAPPADGAVQDAPVKSSEAPVLAAISESHNQEKPAADEYLAKTPATTAEPGGKAEQEPKLAEETRSGAQAAAPPAAPPAMPPAMPPAKEATQ